MDRQADNFKRYVLAFDFCSCLHIVAVGYKLRGAAVLPHFYEWSTRRYMYGSFWSNFTAFLFSSVVVFMDLLLIYTSN